MALARFPQRGVNNVGVRGSSGHRRRRCFRHFLLEQRLLNNVCRQDFLECLAAVGGAIHAALFVRPIRMTGNGGKNFIGIARINGELRNLLALAKAKMRPGLACVGGFVDAVADGEVRPVQPLTAPDINNFGSDGATAIAPIDPVGCWSKIGCHVWP